MVRHDPSNIILHHHISVSFSHIGPSQGLDEKIHMPQPPEGAAARSEPLHEVEETGQS